jgi:hypothetical protein
MMSDLFSLAGRTALITGGSRGIGRMIAAGFIAQGARVYISSRKAGACEETATELSRNGGTCIPLPQDVSTVEGAKLLARAYCEREPKLDILVNNAGAAWLAEFDAFPLRYPPFSDLSGKHRAESVPPKPDRLMADVDPALGQEILDVAQRQRVLHVHQHRQTDYLGRATERPNCRFRRIHNTRKHAAKTHAHKSKHKKLSKLCYLWRAVDHEGEVLEAVVTHARVSSVAVAFG